jgi:hypothetical protein
MNGTQVQEVYFDNGKIVYSIRPYLMAVNVPDDVEITLTFIKPNGTFFGTIFYGERTYGPELVLATKTYTIADLKQLGSANLSATYWHGYISFDFESVVCSDGYYNVEIATDNYLPTASSYLSWVCEHDNIVPEVYGNEIIGNQPRSVEFYTWQTIVD